MSDAHWEVWTLPVLGSIGEEDLGGVGGFTK